MIHLKLSAVIALLVITILVTAFVPGADSQKKGIIIVRILGFRNDRGVVRITLFDQKDGFPNQYRLARTHGDSPIQDLTARYIFRDVDYGAYGIGVFHDEDGNGELKTGFLGIPREGIGVSNNVRARFGPPKFEDCLFTVDCDTLALSIDMVYM